jgi:hypothetical protein
MIPPDQFRVLLNRLGLSTEAAARLTHTDPRRFRRWLDGQDNPLPAAVVILQAADEVPGVLDWLRARYDC